MPTKADIVNRALAVIGTRTTVTTVELAANSSNEAIQVNLIYEPYRNQLLRMAPWNCAFNTASLTYITSVPSTPENPGTNTALWAKGQPAPPYAYEYQYPVNCLRACWVTPQTATGFASGIPITTAITGGAPSFWQGPPVKFKVGVDQFFTCSVATPVLAGSGYAIGDIVFLPVVNNPGPNAIVNKLGTFQANSPQGAGAQLQVLTVDGAGAILTVAVVNQVLGANPPLGGSYYYQYTTRPTTTTTGAGTGATFSIDISDSGIRDQRVILTNQEFAILNYCKLITDESVFDDDFQEAFVKVLGVGLVNPLTGDKGLATQALAQANAKIMEARGTDGNEGLTVNDVLPDWIRARGVNYTEDYSGPYNTGFNWGAMWPGFS